MKTRTYNQYCGLAYALDVVGERWTLLIVREMIAGPRRFKDLINGLPDISTNLLAERLKELEQQGIIIRRTLPPPAGSNVYELTALGLALEPMLLELGKWGSQFVPPSSAGVHILRAGSYALTPKTFFHPDRAEGINEIYTLHVGDERMQMQIQDEQLHIQQGEPMRPDVVFHIPDTPTYLGLLQGAINPDTAVADGLVRVEGDPAALKRFLACCSMSPDPA